MPGRDGEEEILGSLLSDSAPQLKLVLSLLAGGIITSGALALCWLTGSDPWGKDAGTGFLNYGIAQLCWPVEISCKSLTREWSHRRCISFSAQLDICNPGSSRLSTLPHAQGKHVDQRGTSALPCLGGTAAPPSRIVQPCRAKHVCCAGL